MQEGADLVGREGDSFPDTYACARSSATAVPPVWAAAPRQGRLLL